MQPRVESRPQLPIEVLSDLEKFGLMIKARPLRMHLLPLSEPLDKYSTNEPYTDEFAILKTQTGCVDPEIQRILF
jgi:hypothetical protein